VEVTLMNNKHVPHDPVGVQRQFADFLSLWWPLLAATICIGFVIYRGVQSDFPAESWLRLALVVILSSAFTLALVRKPW
jgi:hypothetical protein